MGTVRRVVAGCRAREEAVLPSALVLQDRQAGGKKNVFAAGPRAHQEAGPARALLERFREFVTYSRDSSYPEYLIEHARE